MIDTEKYAAATVVSRRDLATDLWVVRIRPDCELPFRPGQYVTLGLELDGRIVERPYSIASDPAEDEIELFIERVPEGELSAPLHDVPIGEATLVRKRCKGLFLKEAPVLDQPHLFVSTVTGIAPFVSILRSLRRRQASGEWTTDKPVLALQGASRSEELGYEEELRALDRDCEWFTYVPTISRPWDDPGWSGETGRVEDVLRKHADAAGLRPGHGAVYLCGHPGMIANGRGIMRRHGFDDKEIREEQYWPD
jgi:ferredoxin--NADP+ reductase